MADSVVYAVSLAIAILLWSIPQLEMIKRHCAGQEPKTVPKEAVLLVLMAIGVGAYFYVFYFFGQPYP